MALIAFVVHCAIKSRDQADGSRTQAFCPRRNHRRASLQSGQADKVIACDFAQRESLRVSRECFLCSGSHTNPTGITTFRSNRRGSRPFFMRLAVLSSPLSGVAKFNSVVNGGGGTLTSLLLTSIIGGGIVPETYLRMPAVFGSFRQISYFFFISRCRECGLSQHQETGTLSWNSESEQAWAPVALSGTQFGHRCGSSLWPEFCFVRRWRLQIWRRRKQ